MRYIKKFIKMFLVQSELYTLLLLCLRFSFFQNQKSDHFLVVLCNLCNLLKLKLKH